jgi:hypothetical protein
MTQPNAPFPGERIHFDGFGGDTVIRVASLHEEQPLADDGIFIFEDQYGDLKLCEDDGHGWVILLEHKLSTRQQNKVFDILYANPAQFSM